MRLINVQIRRYRAFDQRVQVPIHDLTVLTGPNNLGKSTVLSALDLFFSVFQPRTSFRIDRRQRYVLEEDYPKKYEGRAGRRWPTQIRTTMRLDDEDIEAISGELDRPIENEVRITVEFHLDERFGSFRPKIEVEGANSQAARTAFYRWMRKEVRYVYIPATRNVHDFRRVAFGELIAGALNRVRRSRQRLRALERLFEDVKEEIAGVERELVEELRQYLPSVRHLNFAVGDLDLDRLVHVGDVEIDDGAKTPLEQKGDGFKSLFAISLLQYIAKQRYGTNLVFGIEEPEAHLHSSAIYEIKTTLRSLAESFQVLVTTHSPILIQRDQIDSNIIVESVGGKEFASSTKAARTLADVRRSLGIRPHENMTTAEVVVVVEGITEERTLPILLAQIDDRLEETFSSGRTRVLGAGGASNVPAVVRALARDATSCLVFVDADSEGERAAQKVRNSGLLQPNDVFRVPRRQDCPETEFEDMFEPSVYLEVMNREIGLRLTVNEFDDFKRRTGRRGVRYGRWSEVMVLASNDRGLEWEGMANMAKASFATAIIESVRQGRLDRPQWLSAVATRILRYLDEENRAAQA